LQKRNQSASQGDTNLIAPLYQAVQKGQQKPAEILIISKAAQQVRREM